MGIDRLPDFNSQHIDHTNPCLRVVSFLLSFTRPWLWVPPGKRHVLFIFILSARPSTRLTHGRNSCNVYLMVEQNNKLIKSNSFFFKFMPHRPSNIILITYRIYLHTSVMTFLVFVLLILKFSSITRPYVFKFFYSPTLQHF